MENKNTRMDNNNTNKNLINNSDDSNTESENDSISYFDILHYDSDDEYKPNKRNKSWNSKRLQTQNGGGKYRFTRNSTSSIEENRLERLPTRRPDPKVFNRNALLARENRRKKKEEMEQRERKFDQIKSENKHMKQMMKQQGIIIQKLTNEKLYLRSIISNRTEILSLLQTIRPSNLPITSSALKYKSKNANVNLLPTNVISSEEENDYDLGYGPSLSTESFTFSDSLDDYENLLNDDNYNISEINKNIDTVVSSEHNYHSKVITNKIEDSGVCLHVTSGRVSLEFCSSCHTNAQNAWINT